MARQLLRAIRGSRSQIAFCRKLGYRSNVATHWEGGSRFPDADEVLRAARVGGIDVEAALVRFHAPAAAAWVEGGVPAWLRALRGSTPHAFVAEAAGASRYQVGRWLRGDATPRLPELLTLIDAMTGRMPDWVAALVDVERVPAVLDAARARQRASRLLFDAPWSPAVITLLATTPAGTADDVAARLRIPADELAPAIDALVEAGLVARVDGAPGVVPPTQALRLLAPLTSSARGSERDRERVRLHWNDVSRRRLLGPEPGDQFGLDVLAVSRDDLARIRERYLAFYREVRAMVAASEPVETAALLVVPPSVPRSMVPCTCTGRPPGEVTIASPMPTVPLGLTTARPRTVPTVEAPHWLSVPSKV
ncbi:MAG: hypothetical protein ABMB14_23510 [Myxococcota bacterium]